MTYKEIRQRHEQAKTHAAIALGARNAHSDNGHLIGLVDKLVTALKLTQFGFNHVRCPVCAGWNVGKHGETDRVHTKECPVAAALTACELE